MDSITFTIPGEPKAKGRPRFNTMTGRAYTPKNTRQYENMVRIAYSNAVGTKKIDGQIEAEIICFFSIPKSENKRRREDMLNGKILHTKKIDCDNIAKIVLDSLNGIAYDDDKQVCKLFVLKRYGSIPCVKVNLKEAKI